MPSLAKIGEKVQQMLYFKTERFVAVEDIRLAILLRAMQALVLFYVLYDVLHKGSYLEIETPNGIANPYADDSPLADLTERDLRNLTYCNNLARYSFAENEVTNWKNFSCIFKRAGLVTKSSGQIAYTTTIQDDKVFFVRKSSAALCSRDGSDYLEGANYQLFIAGACIYQRKRFFMPVVVEKLGMSFWHSYQTSTVHKTGSLPRTLVRRKGSNKNLYQFAAGKAPTLTVDKWLEYAGVDLDLPLNQQPWFNNTDRVLDPGLQGVGASKGKFPYPRVMGVQIVMTLNYYNYELGPGMQSGPKTTEGRVTAILELEPIFTWTGAGSDVQYMFRKVDDPLYLTVPNQVPSNDNNETPDFASSDLLSQGVVFTFRTGGALARFQYRSLINSLVQGAVLMSVAQTIIKFLVLYGMGVASKLYKEFIKEKINYRREYARFAAQALVAGYVFHQMDTHRNDELSASEVHATLEKVLGQKLPKKDLMLLTDFLMRHGDKDEGTHKKSLEKGEVIDEVENSINLEEFIDIFTEDRINTDSLQRILAHEYKDTQVGGELQDQLEKQKPQTKDLELANQP